MTSKINKALCSLSLEEIDVPVDLPDIPEFCSSEKNSLSLVERVLNPEYQSISDLILDMPRKWQLYDRVRGVALSKEKFQFIFKNEADLEEILKKGAHTFNQWSIVMERWIEKLPVDYLQYIKVWVQMRNIPINHYTVGAITWLGEFAGQVVEVAFDPTKAQSKEYVRVLVKFDVANPLRRSKLVNIPSGEAVTILYDYERVQKRCYTCQRLTHDQGSCPIFQRQKQGDQEDEKVKGLTRKIQKQAIINKSDPLFGVIDEDQVGINPLTGRPRIDEEVLDGIRQYLIAANGSERIVREERVKGSLAALVNDPIGQKTMLRLEPAPVVSQNVDKGKGLVFDFGMRDVERAKQTELQREKKLLDSAIRSGNAMVRLPWSDVTQSTGCNMVEDEDSMSSKSGSTESGYSAFVATTPGSSHLKGPKMNRPSKSRRISQQGDKQFGERSFDKNLGVSKDFVDKKKGKEGT